MADSLSQKKYFEQAYRTGSDIWSHVPYHDTAFSLMPELAPDSTVLDLGAGRGIWAQKLIESGLRVIGVDYIRGIVDRVNEDAKESGISEKLYYIEADVLDLPFQDECFTCITDIGVFQHIHTDQWIRYIEELYRVLAPEGYFVNVSLSKRTPQFLGWRPYAVEDFQFEKFGVYYSFFHETDIETLFGAHFDIEEQKTEMYPMKTDPADKIALVFTRMKKKSF